MKVAAWDIDVSPIREERAFAHVNAVDVTDEQSVAAATRATLAALGRVEILVNNAGVNGPTKPFWDYTMAEWSRVIGVDLTGVFLCSRALAPHMRENGYGRMITVASIAGWDVPGLPCTVTFTRSTIPEAPMSPSTSSTSGESTFRPLRRSSSIATP